MVAFSETNRDQTTITTGDNVWSMLYAVKLWDRRRMVNLTTPHATMGRSSPNCQHFCYYKKNREHLRRLVVIRRQQPRHRLSELCALTMTTCQIISTVPRHTSHRQQHRRLLEAPRVLALQSLSDALNYESHRQPTDDAVHQHALRYIILLHRQQRRHLITSTVSFTRWFDGEKIQPHLLLPPPSLSSAIWSYQPPAAPQLQLQPEFY